jgi:hypothetical protein
MTTSMRLVAEDGATTIVWLRPSQPSTNDAIFLQNSELPMAGPRVVDQPRAGASGRLDLTQYHDSTTFKADLVIQDDGTYTRHQYIDILRQTAAPARRPYLYVLRDGWLSERRAALRGDAQTVVVDKLSAVRLVASIQFAVPDGVLEDTALSTAVIRPASSTVGRTYPKTYPWAYASANTSNALVVTSNGTVSTPPLLRLYGAFTDPVISNLTTGQRLKLTSVSLSDGQYLEIDMANRTIYLNSDPAQSYYSKLDFTTSTWWELQPGQNLITATATSLDASCELDLFWRDRWI